MATNIPPHNLVEVIDAAIELSKKPEMTIQDLMENLAQEYIPLNLELSFLAFYLIL